MFATHPSFGEPVATELQTRKRRRQPSSEDEIEGQLDERHKGRRGWAFDGDSCYLNALPLRTFISRGNVSARGLVPNAADHEVTISNILLKSGFSQTNTSFAFVFRVPADARDEPLDEYLTLTVSTDMVRFDQNIHKALIRLRHALAKSEDTQSLMIEFIDTNIKGGMCTFPLKPGDRPWKTWDKVHHEVGMALARMRNDWFLLQCMHYGSQKEQSKCPPTILIVTPTANSKKRSWIDDVIPQLRKISQGLPLDIYCKPTWLTVDNPYMDAGRFVNDLSYTSNVFMGSSISAASEKYRDQEQGKDVDAIEGKRLKCKIEQLGGGTIGGRIVLEPKDGKRRFITALTNYHVIVTPDLEQALESTNKDPAKRKSLDSPAKVFKIFGGKIEYVSPSNRHHFAHLEMLDKVIAETTDFLESNPNDPKTFINMLAEEQKRKKNHADSDRAVGFLVAASGRREAVSSKYGDQQTGGTYTYPHRPHDVHNFPLDWALIQCDDARKPINRWPLVGQTDVDDSKIASYAECATWTTFNCNIEAIGVAKFGSTAGPSFGELSSLLVFNPAAYEVSDIAKTYNFAKPPDHDYTYNRAPRVGKAWEVFPRGKARFIAAGDSGSILVHEKSHAQLGLLFADGAEGTGLMIPFGFIKEDIEKVTGMKVVEPVFIDPIKAGTAKKEVETPTAKLHLQTSDSPVWAHW